MANCQRCGCELIPLAISFSKKLFGRGSDTDFCIDCLEKEFSYDDATLLRFAERWTADGCALFSFTDPDTVKNFFSSR